MTEIKPVAPRPWKPVMSEQPFREELSTWNVIAISITSISISYSH